MDESDNLRKIKEKKLEVFLRTWFVKISSTLPVNGNSNEMMREAVEYGLRKKYLKVRENVGDKTERVYGLNDMGRKYLGI